MDAKETSRRVYRLLAERSSGPQLGLRTWDGDYFGPSNAPAILTLQHPGAFRALVIPPSDLTAAEAYIYDDVDVEGDMVALMEFLAGLQPVSGGIVTRARMLSMARRLPSEMKRTDAGRPSMGKGQVHSRGRDERAVTHHYDRGNEFFELFLDRQMVYSCADFLRPGDSLDVAQARKLDLICRKLTLQPGMRFLDVGCGWGALVIHAAQKYGVEATGITLSRPQADFAEMKAKEAGVENLVTIIRGDYRDLQGTYDAIASVGMFEHVGRSQLFKYFTTLRQHLATGGQLLNHGIVTRKRGLTLRRPTFVSTYVFPDSHLVPVETVIGAAEKAGFELRDAESLRASYALTLRSWVANLERNARIARELVGERTYRIWRLYMAGSVTAFAGGHLSIFQLLLSDPTRPWTFGRRHLLADDDATPGPSPDRESVVS